MRLKNWSLIYPDGRAPILFPGYCLLSALPYVLDDDTALKFARVKRFAEFARDEIALVMPAHCRAAQSRQNVRRIGLLFSANVQLAADSLAFRGARKRAGNSVLEKGSSCSVTLGIAVAPCRGALGG